MFMNRLTATASETDRGRKIKYFVRSEMGVSYRQFSALKTWNGLRVNGEIVHANHLLEPGDRIEVLLEDTAQKAVEPDAQPVCIVYEDSDLLIIDKPAPLACQCSPKTPGNSLENRLAWHFRSVENFVFRPLNRLDKGTSGLLAAAKHAHATQLLQKQLHTPSFIREYLAVVEGRLEGSGTIDAPISKVNDATIRRFIDWENGKPAVTHYTSLAVSRNRSLVRLRLETGRTHQIRLHLSHLGYPIVGDFLYGTEIPELPGRFALHSAYIALDHPLTGVRIEHESQLPPELQQLLEENT